MFGIFIIMAATAGLDDVDYDYYDYTDDSDDGEFDARKFHGDTAESDIDVDD